MGGVLDACELAGDWSPISHQMSSAHASQSKDIRSRARFQGVVPLQVSFQVFICSSVKPGIFSKIFHDPHPRRA
jgi:hypothetical protein